MNTAISVSGDISSRPVRPEWFASWFDSDYYHRLYANRDELEASRFLDNLIAHGHLGTGTSVLDLGCGSGRHSRYLAARGYDVTGLDLSAESLNRARVNAPANVRFVRQDMRLPFRTGPFDHVVNLFTSFGYFADPADNVSVLHNVAAALREGGNLVVDYLNVHRAVRDLKGREIVERGGVVYRITRWADANDIFKRVVIEDSALPHPLAFVERVARLAIDDFRFLFALCGLALDTAYGDYQLAAFDPDRSARLILVARKMPLISRAGLSPREVAPDAADRFRRHAEV